MSMCDADLYLSMMEDCLSGAFPTAKVLDSENYQHEPLLFIEFELPEQGLYGQVQQISYFNDEAYVVSLTPVDKDKSPLNNDQISGFATQCDKAFEKVLEALKQQNYASNPFDLSTDVGQLILRPKMEIKAKLKLMKPLEIVDAFRLAGDLGFNNLHDFLALLPDTIYCDSDLQHNPKLKDIVAKQSYAYHIYADELLYQYNNDDFFDASPLNAGKLLDILEDVPDFNDPRIIKANGHVKSQFEPVDDEEDLPF